MIGSFEIYTMENCPFCTKAKELLWKNNVYFTEKKLNETFSKHDLANRLGVDTESRITLPQIFLDNENIGGYNELKICFDAIRMMKVMKGTDT